MRIWCCLYFIDDEEEDNQHEGTMKEGFLANVDDFKGNIVNGDEDHEEEEEAFAIVTATAAAAQFALPLNRQRQRDETLLLFEEMVAAMRCGGNWDDAEWHPSVRCTRPSEGETSASASTAVEDCDHHDSHHKRAKVYFGSRKSTSSSSAERDYNINQGSSISSNSGIFYHNFMLSNGSDGHPFDANGGNDEEDEGGLRTEDFEIRMDLTDDLLHMVFSFLDHHNLCHAAMVCKQWRAASAHEDFWRCLNFENRNIYLEQFEDMCQRYPNATEVNLSGTPNIHLLAMKAVSSLRNLEALTLGNGQLGDAFFHALVECSMLRRLDVNNAILGNGVQEIPINHDRLRDLKVTKCRLMRISVRCPQLKSLSLKRSNMAQVALNCPLLHLLDISSCHKLTDAAIRSAVTSCPQLESLDMSNCSCVSDETLREIALTCANLHVLNSSYCPNISLESVRLPTLTVLKLDNCEGITSVSMAAISHSYMLEELELDNCDMLTSVSLDLPHLQKIRLVHCRKFADLNLQCFMLSSITVSNCAALHHININSNSLQKLALQKQENLTMLALQCQCLQEVDLTDCASLTNSICNVFSDGGGCPMLKSLVLDNCEVLKLQACKYLADSSLEPLYKGGALRELRDLDLSYGTLCQSAIEELLAYCTHLTHLSLNGCINMHDLNWSSTGGLLFELLSAHNGSSMFSFENINEPVEQANRLLQNLNCVGCPNIRKVLIPPTARCFHLSSLNLSLSGNLKEVDLVCFNLSFLNLSNCCSLEVLKLGCPRLTSLFLQSCNIEEDAIETAISQCSMLETLDVRFCPKICSMSMGRLRAVCPSLKRTFSSLSPA
ncbi:F-box/LRR-repeat protein 15-like isoform X6 [Durio zibethinus]|uniref:F-box/LRR-repeat protein 15-like isoform X6 n=1 Tax=Durio zibethinus TaxID=66656 RepID=A0A6P5ZB31_DURZI|nr:F-box/LRR-repeat protein 15-like isoform X6 [Durio zibethinus]